MEQLIFFHDHTIIVILIIIVLVSYVLFGAKTGGYNLGLFEGQELERVWTVLPALFLLLIAFPSIKILYLMEEGRELDITVKVIGHQWYWSYEYGDLGGVEFDSYIDSDFIGRLILGDNILVLPVLINIRTLVSRGDVIHSWVIPRLGIRVDAVPGRLNYLVYKFNRVGLFIGQCSEICGANHRFIPISVIVTPQNEFLKGIIN